LQRVEELVVVPEKVPDERPVPIENVGEIEPPLVQLAVSRVIVAPNWF
jgi:hypothetical protein